MNDWVGSIIACNLSKEDELYLVVDQARRGCLECLKVGRQQPAGYNWKQIDNFWINLSERSIVETSSVLRVEARVAHENLDEILRATVKAAMTSYYHFAHRNDQTTYREGDRIPYAGRVYDDREMLALTDAAMDFWLTSGRFTERFERSFSEKLGVRFCALVNSGSSANLLAVAALTSPLMGEKRLRPGDEIITVAAGFPTTIAPILQNGCVPVFVDVKVDDGTYNIDLDQVEEAISDKTRAVIVAHTLGNPVELTRLTDICKRNNLWFIEDNCDALGSTYNDRYTGSFGDLATSSFYPPHHITMGEGGAVYSCSIKMKRPVESFRDWGRDCWCASGKDNTCGKRFQHKLGSLPRGYDHKYIYRHFGYNLKATDLQAAIGCVQLEKLDEFVAARRRNWQALFDGLKDLEERIILPRPTPGSEPSWFGFLLSVRKDSGLCRDALVTELEKNNIQTRMLFAGNLLRHPVFDELNQSGKGFRIIGDLRNSDFILNNTLWLGVYPGLKAGMIERMLDCIRACLA